MNTQTTDVATSVEHATLFAELASLEVDLVIMFDLQQKANQAAIWSFNAWATTDAFIERETSKDFINRLEQQSKEADALKAKADLFVQDLRDKKRKLTRKLKSKAYSAPMILERERAEATANANMQAMLEAASEANTEVASEQKNVTASDATQENASSIVDSKPQKKRGLKNAAIAK